MPPLTVKLVWQLVTKRLHSTLYMPKQTHNFNFQANSQFLFTYIQQLHTWIYFKLNKWHIQGMWLKILINFMDSSQRKTKK